jgi:hypothetical protein
MESNYITLQIQIITMFKIVQNQVKLLRDPGVRFGDEIPRTDPTNIYITLNYFVDTDKQFNLQLIQKPP